MKVIDFGGLDGAREFYSPDQIREKRGSSKMRTTIGIFLCGLIAFGNLWAQTTAVSQVSGTVQDPSGLPVVGATMSRLPVNFATGFNRSAIPPRTRVSTSCSIYPWAIMSSA